MQQTSLKDANEVKAWKQNSADFQNFWLLLVFKSTKHMESSSCLCEIPCQVIPAFSYFQPCTSSSFSRALQSGSTWRLDN